MKNNKPLLSILLVSACLSGATSRAATFSLSGNYRFGGNMYSNLDLTSGSRKGAGNTVSFLEHRFSLHPDVVIDDRLSIKSSLSFAQYSVDRDASGSIDAPGSMGTSLDSRSTNANGQQAFQVKQLYLNWASDWGLFRFGRFAKAWGLGLRFDPGSDPLDDFPYNPDRAEFQAMLGNLQTRLAYEKPAEGQLDNDSDDVDLYEVAVEYLNPESQMSVGILYDRVVRSAGAGLGPSSHDLSLYAKKQWEKLSLGAEFASLSTENRDSANGVLAQVDFNPSRWSWGADFAYASSSDDNPFKFSNNYRPLLILFRQSVGPHAPVGEIRGGQNGTPVGSDITGNGASGAILAKGEGAYNFEKSGITLGMNVGWAQLGDKGSASSNALGIETDLYVVQNWYDNFKMHYTAGVLLPGDAFDNSPQMGWGLEVKGVLSF